MIDSPQKKSYNIIIPSHKGGFSLHIKYDSQKLNDAIKHFCILTNISILVLDSEFNHLAFYTEEKPSYCTEIQKSPLGKSRCLHSDMVLLEKCRDSHKTQWHICHAGILDIAMPILKNDTIIGYILIGRTRVLAEEKALNYIKEIGINNEKMKDYYREVTGYNKTQIHSMLKLASMMVSFILTNDIIHIQTNPLAEAAVAYIDAHINEKISIDMLCKELNASRNQLYLLFHTNFNTTVNDYIISRKLQVASKLLKNTDLSINSIAEEIGISTYTYFSKLFKDKFHISPLAYRKASRI